MKIFYINLSDDETGITAISLVENPAVDKNFLCFEEQKELIKFSKDEAKHLISGVVMLADTPIYRRDEVRGEYYVVFTKDVILKMIEKFSKQGLFSTVNLQHNNSQTVDDIYMVESYIVDKERGICPNEFQDITDGSWIVTYKVDNEPLWEEIINGNKLNGFSLEGIFDIEDLYFSKEEESFEEWLKQFIS